MKDEGIATIEEELDQTEAFDNGPSPETSQIDEVISAIESDLDPENENSKVETENFANNNEKEENENEAPKFQFSSLQEVTASLGMDQNWQKIAESKGGDILSKNSKEWLYKDENGKRTSITAEIQDPELAARNTKMLEDLYTTGFSISEYPKPGSDTLIREVFFADEKGNISYELYTLEKEPEVLVEVTEVPEIVSDDNDEDYPPSFIGSLEALKAQLDLETIPAEANIGTLELESSVGEILNETSGIEISDAFDDHDDITITTPTSIPKVSTPKVESLPVTQNILGIELIPAKSDISEVYTPTNIEGTLNIQQIAELSQSESIAPSEDSEESSVKFQTTKSVDRIVLTEPNKNAIDLFIDQSTFVEEAPEENVKPNDFETITIAKEAQLQILKLKEETKFIIPETSATYAVVETWETGDGIEILDVVSDSEDLNNYLENESSFSDLETLEQELPEVLIKQTETLENAGITLTQTEETEEIKNLEPFITVQKFVRAAELAQSEDEIETQEVKITPTETTKPEVQAIGISGIILEEATQITKTQETQKLEAVEETVVQEQEIKTPILKQVLKPQEAISIVDSGEEVFDVAFSKIIETSSTRTEARTQIVETAVQQVEASGIKLVEQVETVIQRTSTQPVRINSVRTRTVPNQTKRTQTQSSARRTSTQPNLKVPTTPTRTTVETAQRPQVQQQREVQKPQIAQRTPTRTTVIPTQITSSTQQVSNSSKSNIQPITQRTSTSTTVIDSSIRPALRTNTKSSISELNNKVLNFRPTTTTNEEVVTNEENSPFELELAA